jgi:hypothetical protein
MSLSRLPPVHAALLPPLAFLPMAETDLRPAD